MFGRREKWRERKDGKISKKDFDIDDYLVREKKGNEGIKKETLNVLIYPNFNYTKIGKIIKWIS